MADPANALVPFGRFDRLHFARFVILDPQTLDDIGVYGGQPPPWPASLAFLGDCDGDAAELRRRAGRRRPSPGCAGSSPTAGISGRARTCATG